MMKAPYVVSTAVWQKKKKKTPKLSPCFYNFDYMIILLHGNEERNDEKEGVSSLGEL